jgi:hypothetical protein
MQQNICPICTAPFEEGVAVVEYRVWTGENLAIPKLAHIDCLLSISEAEIRSHPPKSGRVKRVSPSKQS